MPAQVLVKAKATAKVAAREAEAEAEAEAWHLAIGPLKWGAPSKAKANWLTLINLITTQSISICVFML